MDIQDLINGRIEAWSQIGHAAAMERFVLENGVKFDGVTRNTEIRKLGTPKECFKNATGVVFQNGSKATYVEGFVVYKGVELLIHHAWVMFEDGTWYDPTLKNPDEFQYFGVPFSYDLTLKQTMKQEYYGLLAGPIMVNIEFMDEFSPGFKAKIERML